MSGTSGSYNAVTWLLDRNVDEGRGAKLAFTDTVSELTYGDLQRQSRRAANMLRRLGVRREERVAMIMLDTTDFPVVFLGAIRAGIVPVPLNTLLTSDQYAYVLADCRARVLFISEALLPVVKDVVGRLPDLEHVVVSGKDAHGHKKLSDELARESARHSRGRCLPFGGKAVLRLWPRQCADLSDVGRRVDGPAQRPADAGCDVRADEQV